MYWKKLDVQEYTSTVQLGNVEISYYQKSDEWFFYWHYTTDIMPFTTIAQESVDESIEWKSILLQDTDSLYLSLALPDRPLIIKPDRELFLLAGHQVTIYIEVPLTLVCSANETSDIIAEVPTEKLPRTWFGDPTKGELSFVLKTGMVKKRSDLNPVSHRAIAPVTIHNTTATTLKFKKLSLLVRNFALYCEDEIFWTDHQQVQFRGVDQESRIKNMGKPAHLSNKAVTYPTNASKPFTQFVRKTFDTFTLMRG